MCWPVVEGLGFSFRRRASRILSICRRPAPRQQESDGDKPEESAEPPDGQQELERFDCHREETQLGQGGDDEADPGQPTRHKAQDEGRNGDPRDEKPQADDIGDPTGDEREKRQSVRQRQVGGDFRAARTQPRAAESMRKAAAVMPPKKPMAGPGTRTPSRSCRA